MKLCCSLQDAVVLMDELTGRLVSDLQICSGVSVRMWKFAHFCSVDIHFSDVSLWLVRGDVYKRIDVDSLLRKLKTVIVLE